MALKYTIVAWNFISPLWLMKQENLFMKILPAKEFLNRSNTKYEFYHSTGRYKTEN